MTETPLPWEQLADLRDAFIDSDLPMKVDLVDWATASDAFRRIIARRYMVLQTALAPAAQSR